MKIVYTYIENSGKEHTVEVSEDSTSSSVANVNREYVSSCSYSDTEVSIEMAKIEPNKEDDA